MSDETNTNEVASEEAPAVEEPSVASDDWKSSLPDDLRDDSSLADIKDVESLAKGFVSAQRMIGGMVRIPGEDAGKEQIDEFYSRLEKIPGVARINEDDKSSIYNKLGRPEDADGYKVDIEGVDLNASEVFKEFKSVAHDIGLSNDQITKIAEFELARENAMAEKFEADKVQATEVLKTTWGADFDNRLEGAKAAARVLSEQYPDAMESLINSPAGNNPAVMFMLSQLGESYQEKGHASLATTPKYGLTPDDAKVKIEEIMANREHPYHHAKDASHEDAVKRVGVLYQVAYPDDKG